MDTLASIALAAAHLDTVVDGNNSAQRNPTSNESQMVLGSPAPSSPVMPILPPRQAFGTEGARVVSTESMASFSSEGSSSSSQEHVSADEVIPSDPESMEGLILLQTLDARSHDTPPPPSPTEVISSVKEDDVLCGRGGETNHHPGNIRYRGLVKKYQLLYLKAKRRDKHKIARLIVDTIRRRYGRFLKKDSASNTWRDVGNSKAREKTSQALREGAPELRNGQPPKNKNAKKRKRDNSNTGAASTTPALSPSNSNMEQLSMAAAIVSPTTSFVLLSDSSRNSSIAAMIPAVPSDDEEEDCSHMSRKTKQVRGPRLKLLKARLVGDESD